MVDMIRVGIIGGAGYTGGELIRLLLLHSHVSIVFVHSKSQANQPIYKVHKDLIGETAMHFTQEVSQEIDVLFLCVGHGDAKVFLEEHPLDKHIKIIDLSQDYRLKSADNSFVYGLPELNREKIREAKAVANPGCFATAIQLALLPLVAQGLIKDEVVIHALTGSTGAGQSLSETSHFSWRANNVSAYKAFTHQHLKEIKQSLVQLEQGFDEAITFVPIRGDFTRGIFTSLVVKTSYSLEELYVLFNLFYQDHPFVHITLDGIDLKQVVNTNKCLISLVKEGEELLIVSTIDNLLKGASGQAVQNMNLMFGLAEDTGLRLKASAF